MIYVKKLIIENFQSHKYTELDLDSGLNVIVGPSDQGKSAIIRALKWVFFNEPRGFEFLRYGETTAKVTVYMSNGSIVSRERSSSKNRYIVTNETGQAQVYEGFGNEIPREVINAHTVEKALIDTNSNIGLNLADQLEAPFLLSENGGIKAKAIGRLTGVHIIDKAVAMTLADIKRENINKNKIDDDYARTMEDLKNYEGLEQQLDNLKTCEDILIDIENKAKRLDKLKDVKQILDYNLKENYEYNKVLKKFEDLDKVSYQVSDLENKYYVYYRLREFKNKLDLVNKQIVEHQNVMDKTKNIDEIANEINDIYANIKQVQLEKDYRDKLRFINKNINFEKDILEKYRNIDIAEENINICIVVIQTLNKLMILKKQHDENTVLIQKGNQYLIQRKEEIEHLIRGYSKTLEEIGKCPVCFNDIDNSTVSHIVKSMKGE